MSDLAIGIMSGTSGDGVDAALVEIDGAGRPTDVIAHRHSPFAPELRERILAAGAGRLMSLEEVARLHGALGDAYAEAALAVATTAPRRPAVIGVHGQTVAHLPNERVTLQIGDAARVAVRTGIATVDDFRSADVAEGGQGAPLTPFADRVLFAHGAPRVVVNVGGIANATLLPDTDPDHVSGFDTGPGNMVIDAIALRGGRPYDADGEGARRGRVITAALLAALDDPYFSRASPKSAGREQFGEPFVTRLLRDVRLGGGSSDDALATATELTARTIAEGIRRATRPGLRWNDVVVAGGGAANPTLMGALSRSLAPIPVRPTDEVGIPAQAREAVAFAILALYRMRRLPNTLPRVTGASRAVSAGAVHQP